MLVEFVHCQHSRIMKRRFRHRRVEEQAPGVAYALFRISCRTPYRAMPHSLTVAGTVDERPFLESNQPSARTLGSQNR